ncbi:MAG: hypothetical protein V1709_00410 [Planctomycetota bacterium]
MKNRLRVVLIIVLGLLLWLSVLNPGLNAQITGKKEKIPKGLKTKTEIKYKFVEKSGKYKQAPDNKQIFRYDDKGNKIEMDLCSADGKLAYKEIYKYDDKGNQIEDVWCGTEGRLGDKVIPTGDKTLYKYDDKGNQIEKASYGADGKLRWKFLSKYDDKGNQIERAEYGYGDDGKSAEKQHSLFKSKYDDKDNMIEMDLCSADGKLRCKFLYKYDDKGNMIEVAACDADGKLDRKNIYKYKYDDKDNKTEQLEYRIEKSFFGKVKEVLLSQTVWEYEFYKK